MLHVFSLFSLLTVLLIVAESRSIPGNVMRRWYWRSVSLWRVGSDRRAFYSVGIFIMGSSVSLSIGRQFSFS